MFSASSTGNRPPSERVIKPLWVSAYPLSAFNTFIIAAKFRCGRISMHQGPSLSTAGRSCRHKLGKLRRSNSTDCSFALVRIEVKGCRVGITRQQSPLPIRTSSVRTSNAGPPGRRIVDNLPGFYRFPASSAGGSETSMRTRGVGDNLMLTKAFTLAHLSSPIPRETSISPSRSGIVPLTLPIDTLALSSIYLFRSDRLHVRFAALARGRPPPKIVATVRTTCAGPRA